MQSDSIFLVYPLHASTSHLLFVIYLLAAVNDYNYRYTIGVDTQDVYLWYLHTSVPLTDIYWKLADTPGDFLNPLDVYSLTYHLNHIGDVILECFDIESRNSFINVGLQIQGLYYIYITKSQLLSVCLFVRC